jgi:hypothetical protein
MYSAPTNGPTYAAYAAKIESYERIAFDSAAGGSGRWYVWMKTGTRFTYAPRLTDRSRMPSDVFAWRLASVEDTFDRVVTCTYTPDLRQDGITDAADDVGVGVGQILARL